MHISKMSQRKRTLPCWKIYHEQSLFITEMKIVMMLCFPCDSSMLSQLWHSTETYNKRSDVSVCYRKRQMARCVHHLTCVWLLFMTNPEGWVNWADEGYIDFLWPQGGTVLCYCPRTSDSYILIMNYCAIMQQRDRWLSCWHYSLLNVTVICSFFFFRNGLPTIVHSDRGII